MSLQDELAECLFRFVGHENTPMTRRRMADTARAVILLHGMGPNPSRVELVSGITDLIEAERMKIADGVDDLEEPDIPRAWEIARRIREGEL